MKWLTRFFAWLLNEEEGETMDSYEVKASLEVVVPIPKSLLNDPNFNAPDYLRKSFAAQFYNWSTYAVHNSLPIKVTDLSSGITVETTINWLQRLLQTDLQ